MIYCLFPLETIYFVYYFQYIRYSDSAVYLFSARVNNNRSVFIVESLNCHTINAKQVILAALSVVVMSQETTIQSKVHKSKQMLAVCAERYYLLINDFAR